MRHDALYYLCKQTHFHSTALRFVPAADGVLAQLKCMLLHSRGDPLLIPFVDAHSYIILAQNAFVNTGTQKLGGSNGTLRQYTTLTAGGGFPSPAAAAISAVVHSFPAMTAEAALLLTFLTFLTQSGSMLSMPLLDRALRGNNLQRALQGLDDSGVAAMQLAGDLPSLHTQGSDLGNVVAELVAAGAITFDPVHNEVAVVDSVGQRLLTALAQDVETLTFWQVQALLAACRAVPFKYLEPAAYVSHHTRCGSPLCPSGEETNFFIGLLSIDSRWRRGSSTHGKPSAQARAD